MKYPVGGPREPVYALMRSLGFKMTSFGDKEWRSLDGIVVQIYGAGSMARISLRGPDGYGPYNECELDKLSEQLRDLTKPE